MDKEIRELEKDIQLVQRLAKENRHEKGTVQALRNLQYWLIVQKNRLKYGQEDDI